MSAMLAIGVCACGGVGAAARYICDSYIKALWRKTFPLSTFAINVVAGLLAGLVAGLFAANTISPDCRLLLATGFLGGFSTFSTMMNETVTLLRNGKIAWFHRLCAGFDRRARHGRCVRLLAGLSQRKRDSKITSECRDWLQSARSMQPRSGLWESRIPMKRSSPKNGRSNCSDPSDGCQANIRNVCTRL